MFMLGYYEIRKPQPRPSAAAGSTPATSRSHIRTAILKSGTGQGYRDLRGENISSIEVEKALYDHPAVAEAAIVDYPDE